MENLNVYTLADKEHQEQPKPHFLRITEITSCLELSETRSVETLPPVRSCQYCPDDGQYTKHQKAKKKKVSGTQCHSSEGGVSRSMN